MSHTSPIFLSTAITPVELYRFTFGASTFLYTSYDTVREAFGQTFNPEPISRTELEFNGESSEGSVTVTLPADNPVAAMFIGIPPTMKVRLEVFRTDRSSTVLTRLEFDGEIMSAVFQDDSCELLCYAVNGMMTQPFPSRLFQPQCSHVVFSQSEDGTNGTPAIGCTLKRELFRTNAVISAVSQATLTSTAFSGKPDGYFNGGSVQTPGGELRFIVSHAGSDVVLSHPLAVQVGEVIAAYPGCDGREETCRDKFSNVINFAGFTRIPTRNPFNSALT